MWASPMLPQLQLQFPRHDFAAAYALAGPYLSADSRPCPCSGSAICSSPDVNCYGLQDSNCSSLGGKLVPWASSRLLVSGDGYGFHGGILLPASYLHFPKGQLSVPAGPGL